MRDAWLIRLLGIAVLAGCLATAWSTTTHAQDPTHRKPSDILVSKIDTDYRVSDDVLKARFDQFQTSLAEIAKLKTPADNDTSLDAELIRIAQDRVARPVVYEELIDEYIHHYVGERTAGGPRSPGLKPEHETETYRLAWEYLLAAPVSGRGYASGYAMRAESALAFIHNDNTIPLLVYKFNLYSDYAHLVPECEVQQQRLIALLGDFTTVRGLDALLWCAVEGNRAQKGVKLVRGAAWDSVAAVHNAMFPKFALPNSNRSLDWQKVIDAYKGNPAKRANLGTLKLVLGESGA